MDRTEKLTMLIVDDQQEVLDVYRQVLHDGLQHEVECVCMPAEGLHLARHRLFDIAIIDAKIPYKQSQMGGLLLAEEIGRILGSQAVLLMSQYEVKEQVSHFNSTFRFLPKPRGDQSLVTWAEKVLLEKVKALVREQYGFVVMPYGRAECDRWYQETLAGWMNASGYALKRMDQIATVKAINVELLNRIREAHFVVGYMPFENPNVYFEAGYAAALDKFLLLFAPNRDALPFDIRANHVFATTGQENDKARAELLAFMQSLRGAR
jgi:CheY-like chemotaxis protein